MRQKFLQNAGKSPFIECFFYQVTFTEWLPYLINLLMRSAFQSKEIKFLPHKELRNLHNL